jgi:hypothetical protein
MTGRLDDEFDPCIYPQDQYNKKFGTNYFDNHYTKPTEILDLPCFDCLAPLKPFMIRSAILWWKKGTFFYPHIDMNIPTPYLRIWATNVPESYLFVYQDGTNHTNPKWDAGQFYISDTAKMHYAEAMADDAYTFFFCVTADAYEVLKELSNV